MGYRVLYKSPHNDKRVEKVFVQGEYNQMGWKARRGR
jgi:hypothetical protein